MNKKIRLASIVAARAKTGRAEYLQSCLPAERSNAALIYDRCCEYDRDVKNPPVWTDDQIFQAQVELKKINLITAIYENDGCGYQDLAYRVQINAQLSPGAERALSKLNVAAPTAQEAIDFLTESFNRDVEWSGNRYGLK